MQKAELRRFVLDIGRTFGILQCDPEPALKAVAESVTSEVGGLSLRNSPVERKQAQGAVGQAQALLYSQVRALRLDFAERYDCEVPVTSPLFPWLVKTPVLVEQLCSHGRTDALRATLGSQVHFCGLSLW